MYDAIAPYYDAIFPADEEDMRFSRTLLQGKRRLLDIGCATGAATVLFAEPGREITGIDLDAAMIARANAAYGGTAVRFEVLDMTRIAGRFAPASFDGALCFGNTLVHIRERETLARFLADMRGLLAPGGLGLIQILNYARILDRDIRELPPLETPELRFLRRYEPEDSLLRFSTRLEIKAGGEAISSVVSLLPLRPESLERMLRDAGFSSVALYGDFSGGPLRDESFVVLAAAAA